MPREGVTLGQVDEAIEALQAQNKKPSYRNIRSLIGEGSLTTIANHVKELERQRQLEAMPLDSDQPILADPVMKALHAGAEATWSELMAAADAVIEDHQKAADAAVADAKTIAEQAIEQRDKTDAKNQELIKALQAKEDEFFELSKAHGALSERHQDLEKQLVIEQTRTQGRNELVQELRVTIEQTKTEVVNSDRRAALIEERLKETNQEHLEAIAAANEEFEAVRRQLQLQADQAQAKADELQRTLSSQATQIATLTGERDNERQSNRTFAQLLEEAKGELDRHIQTSDKRKGDVATLEERCVSLQTTINGERERRLELMAAKDARIEEQAIVIGDLNKLLEHAQLRPSEDP